MAINRRLFAVIACLFPALISVSAYCNEYAGMLGGQAISLSLTEDGFQAAYYYDKFRAPIAQSQKQGAKPRRVNSVCYVRDPSGYQVAKPGQACE